MRKYFIILTLVLCNSFFTLTCQNSNLQILENPEKSANSTKFQNSQSQNFEPKKSSTCTSGKSENSANPAKLEKLKITNWNLETFFDSTNDGSEYSEFVKSKTWGKEMYSARLERLAQVIKEIDSDVYVMEEIENENVLHDISNFLAGEWNFKKNFKYACFAKDKGSSIGCAVISRYPLKNMSVHSLNIEKSNLKLPSMRPLIQVSVIKGEKELVLLVNHWKSMSGGEEITEKWRNAQEIVLASRLEDLCKKEKAFLALGDFNRDILKFKKSTWSSFGQKFLIRKGQNFTFDDEGIEVLSVWFESEDFLQEPGSYNFKGVWSRIDNMFFGGSASFEDFCVETSGEWFDSENNKPYSYSLWNGKGFSDHLPITATAIF